MKKPVVDKKQKTIFVVVFWILGLLPFLGASFIYLIQSEDDLPPVSLLDNPPELLASEVIAKNESGADTVIGHYWKVNRSSIKYREISPFVIDALISTEDERFYGHSGIDFRALARSATSFGKSGGASTITQQLAKQLFTLQKREKESNERDGKSKGVGTLGRINEKAQEHIIAARLEKRFTKKEIITMYLNQFDFLYNAVGIESAANVYFNKTALELSKVEAAMLVGMCKNPSLYNPYSFKNKNYANKIAIKKNISPSKVSIKEIKEARSKDSIRAVNRRNQVLFQWLRNSENQNESITNKLNRKEYKQLCKLPIIVDYHSVDHKEGMAPYFRIELKKEVQTLLKTKNENGTFKYVKKDGTPYDIYQDGLKIYTTINTSLQQKAEDAVVQHLSGVDPSGVNTRSKSWQKRFDKTGRYKKGKWPFLKSTPQKTIDNLINQRRVGSGRYYNMKRAGFSKAQIMKVFDTPTQMKVFSWSGDIDTIMTPNDSIRHALSFLQTGLISMEPKTGFVRAWVGGINFDYFEDDQVKKVKRQIGSTIKPFVYATALELGSVKPCTRFTKDECQVVEVDDFGQIIEKKNNPFIPNKSNKANSDWMANGGLLSNGLIQSNNPTTAAVFGSMGPVNGKKRTGGPYQLDKLLRKMNIFLPSDQLVPSMCLGTMDLSLYELVAAQCIFANNGVYTKPTIIERIEDRNGRVIYNAEQETEQVINSSVAYEILNLMRGVVQRGTGASLTGSYNPWGGITHPTAGKTGTTQGNAVGLFMGITPDLVTGVSTGGMFKEIAFEFTSDGQGARMALPVYGYYMQKIYADKGIKISTEDFMKPSDYIPERFQCDEDLLLPDENNTEFGEF
ncbi:MAG: transglycosylase domain-containing protein [Crocinitomicaceae bacterium]|nr:transglycosylase domain-containing protein [Crocinitomicaceae bacterium]